MSDIKGLGFNLRDLDALKKQAAQQGVHGGTPTKSNEGVTNVFEEFFQSQGIQGIEASEGSTVILEIDEEDIEALENEELSDKKETEQQSVFAAVSNALQNIVGSIMQPRGAKGSEPKSISPEAPEMKQFNFDNFYVIGANATVEELETLKQKKLFDYESKIATKTAEKQKFVSDQESKKTNVSSQINAQKGEISDTKTQITDTESKISNTKSEISSTESEISSLKSALSAINDEDENASNIRSALEAKIQSLEDKKASLESKKQELETKKSDLENKLSTQEQVLSELESELQNIEKETTTQMAIYDDEIGNIENSKRREISFIDNKIVEAQAREAKQQEDDNVENKNIFVFN